MSWRTLTRRPRAAKHRVNSGTQDGKGGENMTQTRDNTVVRGGSAKSPHPCFHDGGVHDGAAGRQRAAYRRRGGGSGRATVDRRIRGGRGRHRTFLADHHLQHQNLIPRQSRGAHAPANLQHGKPRKRGVHAPGTWQGDHVQLRADRVRLFPHRQRPQFRRGGHRAPLPEVPRLPGEVRAELHGHRRQDHQALAGARRAVGQAGGALHGGVFPHGRRAGNHARGCAPEGDRAHPADAGVGGQT